MESGLHEDDLVLSEVHVGEATASVSPRCTLLITLPYAADDSDSDSDGPPRHLVPRAARLTFSHGGLTPVSAVALQVWRGAFLLAEFIVAEQSRWHGRTVMELGSGVGVVTTVLARFARHVYCTDFHARALALAAANLGANSAWIGGTDNVKFKQLDWLHGWPPPTLAATGTGAATGSGAGVSESAQQRHESLCNSDSGHWGVSQVCDVENTCDAFFGSDLIYDSAGVNALFSMLASDRLLSVHKPDRRFYMALEKRFNFEVETLSARPHGYSAFEAHLCQDSWHWPQPRMSRADSFHRSSAIHRPPQCPSCNCGGEKHLAAPAESQSALAARPAFAGRLLPVAGIAQSVQHPSYDRLSAAFELWEIKRAVPMRSP
jgi:predicted nicotinamide N-methyase